MGSPNCKPWTHYSIELKVHKVKVIKIGKSIFEKGVCDVKMSSLPMRSKKQLCTSSAVGCLPRRIWRAGATTIDAARRGTASAAIK